MFAKIKLRRSLLGGLFVAVIFSVAPVRGSDLLDYDAFLSEDRMVEVYAEKLTREIDLKKTIAEGAVDIRSGKIRLKADKVELDDRTMDLVATGNVIMEAGEDRLQGEYLEFNLRTEVGYVMNGIGFAQAYYFTGERIDKLSEGRYLIKKGSFTSCEGVVPDWSFKSPDALIHVDHYIYAWHPSVWVKKTPVFYLPYAVVPIKRDRATGFLVPRIRFHKTDGLIINNSFFWAPVDNADATIYVDYYSRRGWRFGLESLYLLEEETSGRLLTSFMRDRRTNSNRWDLKYLHKHALPWELNGLINVSFLSDRQYQQDFGIVLEDISGEKLDSFASLSRDWTNTSLILSAEHEESLATEDENTFTRFPELNLKRQSSRIGDSPLFWSLRAQAADLRLKKGEEITETGRLDLAPGFSLPLNIQSWATLRPSLGIDYTYYTENVDGNSADRFIYNPSLAVSGPKFSRIFGEQEELPRFKHLVIPKIIYNYRPDVDQEDLPRFDGIDRVASDNSITYSLTNQVLGKFRLSEEKTSVREVLRIDISQKYDLDPSEVGVEKKYFGDIVLDLTADPTENLSIDADAAYDVNDDGLTSINYGFQWEREDRAHLFFEHRRNRKSKIDFLEGGIGFKPGNWEMAYRGRYDLEESMFIEHIVETKYKAQCWDATLTYVKREDTYEYRFVLNLKELGTIIKF